MSTKSPAKFYKEVKNEMKKVTWPTRQETIVSTISVFVMVFLAAIFLFCADQVLATMVNFILGLGA